MKVTIKAKDPKKQASADRLAAAVSAELERHSADLHIIHPDPACYVCRALAENQPHDLMTPMQAWRLG